MKKKVEEVHEERKVKPDQPSSKRHVEPLNINVLKHNPSYKWQEYRMSSELPERRSYMCSCVYKDKYFNFLKL
jgi:hypothetical protein